MTEPKLRCAYIVSAYPAVTHTFVLREVRALRERGVDVETVSVRRSQDHHAMSAGDRAERDTTHSILPTTPLKLLRAHVAAFAKSPAGYLSTLGETLRDAPLGFRSTAWQLFYFIEGILLWHWLRTQDLRHVHAHHGNVASDLAMISTRFGNRVDRGYTWSVTVHGPTEFADVQAHKLPTKIARADAVVAISDHGRAQLMALVEARYHERIRKIHCGVVPSEYVARSRPGEKRGRFELLTVASLSPRKGQETLLEALSSLRESGRDVHLTIVGDGPARQDIERKAKALGLNGAVTFAGAKGHADVPRFYDEADAFCLPSFAEGVPVVLMEAMASGLPVIATNVMGVAELVSEGCGLLVAPARPDEIADALDQLGQDPALRRDLGEAGRRKVEADFTLENSAASLESLFREVTSKSR